MNPWDLSARAYEISAERTDWWEYALFAQAVRDFIKSEPAPLWMDFNEADSGLVFKVNSVDDFQVFIGCIRGLLQRVSAPVSEFADLLAANNVDAFGLPGDSGNPEKITALAGRVGKFYNAAVRLSFEIERIKWSLNEAVFGRAAVIINSAFGKVHADLKAAAAANIQFFENYGPEILKRIDDASVRRRRGEPAALDLSVNFKIKFDEDGNLAHATTMLEEVNADVQAETQRLQLAAQASQAILSEHSTQGYLYLLLNLSMPGLVKIGKTTRSAEERRRELGSATGVPTPFVIAYEMFVSDCHRAEKLIHDLLEPYRVSESREFFRLSGSDAVDAMLQVKRSMHD